MYKRQDLTGDDWTSYFRNLDTPLSTMDGRLKDINDGIRLEEPRDVTDRVNRVLGQLTDGKDVIDPRNLVSINGVSLTGDDWTSYFRNLDTSLSTLNTSITSTEPRDITDRADRLLGQLTDGTNAIDPRILRLDDGTGTYAEIYRTNNSQNIHITGQDTLLAVDLQGNLASNIITATGETITSGSTYTSSFTDTEDRFGYFIGTVTADNTFDIYIEQSHDGSSIHYVSSFSSETVTASDGSTLNVVAFKVLAVAPYVRIAVKNTSGSDITADIYLRGGVIR